MTRIERPPCIAPFVESTVRSEPAVCTPALRMLCGTTRSGHCPFRDAGAARVLVPVPHHVAHTHSTVEL